MAENGLTCILLLAACFVQVLSEDPALCTVDVVHVIDDIVGMANSIVQTAVDCTLPGINELSCAADIDGLMGSTLDVAGLVGDMTLVCGDLDNTCAVQISGGIEILTGLVATLIAASSDCQSDPFVCTYDVVSAVDTINGFAWNIIGAVRFCDNHEVGKAANRFDYSDPGEIGTVLDRYAYLEFQGHRNWGSFQRRLHEAMVENRLSGEAGGDEALDRKSSAVDSTSSESVRLTRLHEQQTKLNGQLQRIRSNLKAKGVKDVPLPSSMLTRRQAESVFV